MTLFDKIFSRSRNEASTKLVDFMICGAQKSGTSALHFYMNQHPQIQFSKDKEVHFFDNDALFRNTKARYEQYHQAFPKKEKHAVMGEASPSYLYWTAAPKRIWAYNPNIKLIVLLRNPIERAFSHWNMEKNRHIEDLSFWDAITTEPARCKSALPSQHLHFSYVDRGFYSEQIRRLWRFFPKNNILILKSEQLKNAPFDALNLACTFLDLKPISDVELIETHVGTYSDTISKREWLFLIKQYIHDIRALESMLNWDCNEWTRWENLDSKMRD